jgi:hypothetical protein
LGAIQVEAETELRDEDRVKFTLKCSFLEIYKETIMDLLEPSHTNLLVKHMSPEFSLNVP